MRHNRYGVTYSFPYDIYLDMHGGFNEIMAKEMQLQEIIKHYKYKLLQTAKKDQSKIRKKIKKYKKRIDIFRIENAEYFV